MALRSIGRFLVPLLNGGNLQALQAFEAATSAFAITKPSRKLGAVWLDDYVCARRNVNLCEVCWRKYYGWWKRCGYRPDWDETFRADCDGCGRKVIICYSFYPEENFYRVLTSWHGVSPSPLRG